MFYQLHIDVEKRSDFIKAAALIQAMPEEADIEIHLFNCSLFNNECVITWMSGVVAEILNNGTMYIYNGGKAEEETDPICKHFLSCKGTIVRNRFIDFLNFLIRK